MPFEYDGIERFNNDTCPLAEYQINGKKGYINSDCKIIIPAVYKITTGFFNAGGFWRAIVQEKKYYIIDEKGIRISSGYNAIRIRIDETLYAEALCFSLHGYSWKRISTITGKLCDGSGMDPETKDKLARLAIFGQASVVSFAISALCNACGAPIPPGAVHYYKSQAKERAWAKYLETRSIMDALAELV